MRAFLVVAVACAALARPGAARADDRPWADGVADVDQAAALDEFRIGNDLFAQGKLAQAIPHYRAALARWDHPSIEFNLGVALFRLEQPVEAYAHIQASVRFGAAPFDRPELYQQALDYAQLLAGQLATVTIACTLPGTQVTLDGENLMVGVREETRVLRPGMHEVVATRDGYAPTVRALTLMPGTTTDVDVTPVPASEATVLVRRWPTWQPWTVAGAGAALVLLGGALELAASQTIHDYDRQVADLCQGSCGPGDVPPAVLDLASTGRVENVVGVSALAVGAAAAAVGVVLVIRNQPRAVIPAVAPADGGAVVGLVGRF